MAATDQYAGVQVPSYQPCRVHLRGTLGAHEGLGGVPGFTKNVKKKSTKIRGVRKYTT